MRQPESSLDEVLWMSSVVVVVDINVLWLAK